MITNCYIHITRECRNCGALSQVGISDGICFDCRRVIYYYYSDEVDEYDRAYHCEICGGVIGDGWGTCGCYDAGGTN